MKKILFWILGGMAIILMVLIYSRFVGTIGLQTKEFVITTNRLGSQDGIKIVHFSDLHYKKVITEKRVQDLIREINRNKPDIVIFSGDLVDDDYEMKNQDIHFLIQEFSKIEAKYGVYAVLGDMDYQEEEMVRNIYIQSHVTLLKNETTFIYNDQNEKIWLAGMGSYLKKDQDIDLVLSSVTDERLYKILVVHEPDGIIDIFKKIPDVDLFLGGHTIHGSINLPIVRNLLLPDGSKKYYKEKDLTKKDHIYISNGIGVNHINFRLFNRPSIYLYRIRSKNL